MPGDIVAVSGAGSRPPLLITVGGTRTARSARRARCPCLPGLAAALAAGRQAAATFEALSCADRMERARWAKDAKKP